MLLKNRACTITNLQGPLEKLFRCFSTNHLVANAKKCHLLSSSNLPVDIDVNNTKISNEKRVTQSQF